MADVIERDLSYTDYSSVWTVVFCELHHLFDAMAGERLESMFVDEKAGFVKLVLQVLEVDSVLNLDAAQMVSEGEVEPH